MKKVWNLKTKRIIAFVLTLLMTVGCLPSSFAAGSGEGLVPADLTYDNGNIVLSKTAERIGPEEWEVTVRATIKDQPIVRQGMEVVFVLDGSGSMAWCTDETAHNTGDHTHKTSCYGPVCGSEEHTHQDSCYKAVCGNIAHTHGEECYTYICGYTAHTHSDDCYTLGCGLDIHTHQRINSNRGCYRTECTSRNNSSHWKNGSHISGTTCYRSLIKYYQLTCTETEHTEHTDDCYVVDCGLQEHSHQEKCREFTCVKTPHTHEAACLELECTKAVHTHTDDCEGLVCTLGNKTNHSSSGATECTYVNESGRTVDYESRIELAKSTIGDMVDNLNEEFGSDGITFKYVLFSSSGYGNGVGKKNATLTGLSSYDSVTAEGGTYMYGGIQAGLGQFSSDTGTKKMLIVITDGEANDEMRDYTNLQTNLNNFKNPDKTDGVVYTIGFSYANDTLNSIAGNGGKYIHASNADELKAAMSGIESAITAMLVDPMGSTVGFTVGSIQSPTSSVDGSVNFDNNTLYWNPTGATEFENATIEYSYIVSLNESAGMEEKAYSGVDLNAPTSLLYGIKSNSNTNMKSAAFPIPEADYEVSSVQVNWKHGNTDILTPTETEKIIADYTGPVRSTGGYYEPAFQTDYATITENIPQSGNNVYRYTGTTITRNGQVVDAVDPTDAAAYVVTHNYVLEEVYEVVYEYTGEVPAGAPAAYLNNTYAKPGETVTVAEDPQLDGWQFSGWTVAAGGATVTGGAFTMPSGNVKLVGSWERIKTSYQVSVNYFTSTDGSAYVQDNAAPVELVPVTLSAEAAVTVDFTAALTYGGNTYASPALADGSAGQLTGGTTLSVVPADPTAQVTLNLYREVKNPYPATVHFVDGSGAPLAEDMAVSEVLFGDDYDLSAAEDVTSITVDGVVYDFVRDDAADNGTAYTGEMPKGGVEITRVYVERSKAAAVVHYVDEDGNALKADTVSEELYVGSGYDVSEAEDVTSITVDDVIYDFVSDDADSNGTAYTGEMPEGGVEITRVYAERSKAAAIVHYVDEAGNTLQADTVSEDIYVGSSYDVSEAEEVTTITVNGVIYDYISDDTTANGTAYTGAMPEGGVEITRVYAERAKATAIVHYVDESGNTLQPDTVGEATYIGNSYDVSEAETVTTITVNGVIYDYISDDTAANSTAYTGAMPEGGVEITRVYAERSKATAIVHYVDEAGNTLQADTVGVATYIGSSYDVSSAESVTSITSEAGIIYDFVSDDTAANATAYTGEMPEGGVEITRVYAERSKATAIVHYVDEAGNTLQADTVSEATYVGSSYDVSSAESVTSITVDGVIYDFVSDDTAANSTAYTGEMPEGGVEITRVYAERAKATAIVHYVDESGNTLQADTVSEAIYVGSSYDVSEAESISSITVNGVVYDFVSDDTAANSTAYTGTMHEGDVEITRVYAERAKATAIVHYVDESGNTLQADTVGEATYIGSSYDVSSAESVTCITVGGVIYDFVSDDTAANSTAYTGEMPEGGVEITRVYAERSKATAVVHYVDESGNTLQADTVSEAIYVGSSYDVSSAESVTTITVNGVIYDYISDDTTANNTAYTGEMPEGGVEITRVYAERSKATAIVHYVDESGNTLQADTVGEPTYIGSSYDVSEAEDVTSITVDGVIYDFVSDDTAANNTAYTGTMPEGGVEITRVYAERSKATAIVHYVDEAGNTLQADTVGEPTYIGSNYDVSEAEDVISITVNGVIYDYISDDTSANSTAYTGTMPEGGVEITRVYAERAKATATVHYVDEAGNTLQADTISEPTYIGSSYDVSEAETVTTITVNGINYDFVSDDTSANSTAYTGAMPKDGVEITRIYAERGKATAIVHYVDEAGNTLQVDTVGEATYIGSNYDVSEAESVTTITLNGVTYDFVSDDTAANSTAYTGAMPEGGVEITRVYAERAKATAIVHYVDEAGNTLQPDTTSEAIYIGSSYDVSEAESITSITVNGVIYDYISDDTAANGTAYTGTMPEGGVEITRIYAERGKATAIVHYVDEAGNTLQADTVSEAIYVGSSYNVSEAESVTTITVNGVTYDFVSDDTATNGTAYTGVMPEGGVEITRVYAERGKATAIVHYVDENGNTLQPDTTSEPTYIGSNYDVSEAESVTTITVNGVIYDYISDDTAANSTAYTGTMPEGGVEITRVYAERSKATAIVHYIDENGNTLKADTVGEATYIGSEYDVSEAEEVTTITVNGVTYDFVSDDTSANGTAYTGTMPEGGVEITRVYAERGKAMAFVHYVDESGNTLQADTVGEPTYIGNSYDVSEAEDVISITVNGVTYDFVSDDTAANSTAYTGAMPEGGVEITRVYAERGKATAIVHYVDVNGNTLQADTVSEATYIGSEYDVSEAEDIISITVNGVVYDFVSDDTAANSTAYTGVMPEGGVEITRVYAERSKATAIVHYVDESGNTLQADTVGEPTYIGSSYDVSSAESVTSITSEAGIIYDFVSDDTAANSTAYTGAMPEGGVEITRVYAERGKATAIVHYVDEAGNILQADTAGEATYIGSEYDVSEAEDVISITVNGVTYDFVSDDTAANSTAYTGTMPEGGVEITRVYAERGKAIAIVHYVDEAGNTLQADTTSEAIYVGSGYDVSEAESITSITVNGVIYDYISDDTVANSTAYTGAMPEGGVEITRVYAERGKAMAIVHYVDESGNTLQADTVSEAIYVGSSYDVSEAEDVNSITVNGVTYDFVSDDTAANGTAYTGEMPEGGVEITRVYAERSKATAIVHYVDEADNTLQADTISEATYIGSEYDVSEAEEVTTITVNGVTYDFVSDDTSANSTAYTGTMPEGGVEITRVYAERAKATAIVHYVDESGNTLQADTVSMATYIGSNYDVSEAETVTTITVNGVVYDCVSDDTAANSTAYTGTMPEGGVEITRIYTERSKATAIVHYVDENGNTLQADTVSEAIYVGSSYDVSSAQAVTTITVNGVTYDFVSDDTTANGTVYTGEMAEGGVEITRIYAERGKATAIVHYVDEAGNTLQADTVSEDIYVGSSYDVSSAESVTSITVNGVTYDFVSDDTTANGTVYTGEMPEGGVEITRIYAERGKATAIVHYVDEAGNTLQADTVGEATYIGSSYDVSEAEEVTTITVNGVTYDFVSDDTASNSTAYSGEMPEGGVEITRVYAERSKATAIVHYVDEAGNTLQPDTVGEPTYIGSNYDVSEAEEVTTITVNGVIYDYISDDTAANSTAYTGAMPEDGVEITRVYAERSKATAIVHYVDESGNTLQADTVSEAIYVGSNYDVSEAEDIISITVNGVTYDFVSDDTAANSTAYTGTMPEGGVEITRVYAERGKATAIVHYVDEAGNTLQADTVDEPTYIGNSYDVSEAEEVTTITVNGVTYDFVSDDTAANGAAYTGEMPEGGVEITRVYAERGKATAIVHYVGEAGNTLQADTVSEDIYVGSSYDVSSAEAVISITVNGVTYDFVSDDTAINGTSYTGEMPEGGVEITRVYAERSKATAIVHYVDESGNTLQADTVSDATYVGSSYDVSSAQAVTTITVNGVTYDFVSDDTAANGTAYTGTMPEGGVEITRVYAERSKATAIVHYVDESGNTLQADTVSDATYVGSSYDVSSAQAVTTITVNGVIYDYISDDTAANGTAYSGEMPEGGVEITRVYAERSKATAIVHYVDEAGNTLQADTISEATYICSEYDVSEAEEVTTITVNGVTYDFVSDDTSANSTAYTGTMPEGGVEITRVYAERAKATAIVHYVDESGNTLQADTVSMATYIGSNYDVSEAETVTTITVNGVVYDCVSDDIAANSTAYTGTMPEGGVEITRVYAERAKATAIVHYVDESGNTLQPDTVSEAIYVGSSYDVSEAEDIISITVNGVTYDFVSDDTSANSTAYTGTMPEGGVEITRVYAERGKATAIVHYVDEAGNTLQADTVGEPTYIGSNYDVSEAEEVTTITVNGVTYDFVSDDTTANSTAYTGEMPEGGVEITRVYTERSKATAIVHYVDENGNTLQADTVGEATYIGSEYDVSEAEDIISITVNGVTYDFVSDDTAANSTAYTGAMPEGGVEITRVYAERGKAMAIVYYVDEAGNTLQPATVGEPTYIGSSYDVSSAESVTTITVNGIIYDFISDDTAANSTAYTGAMPEGGVEITRIYAERGKATAIVHYVDEAGNTLQADTVGEATYIGSSYDVSEAESVTTITVNGVIYDYISDDTAANSTAYTGTMPEGGVEITRVYAERGKATAIVHYVDEAGNTLHADTVGEATYIGSSYDVSSAESITTIISDAGVIYEYAYDDTSVNSTAYTGEMPEGGVEITRVYVERGKAIAIVHYVDESGVSLQSDTVTDGIYIGNAYDVTTALSVNEIEKDGKLYRFVAHYLSEGMGTGNQVALDDSEAADAVYAGLMPEGGVEITRVYRVVSYYYQLKHVYTAYDASGAEVYSGTDIWPVMATLNREHMIQSPDTYDHGGYTFQRISDAEQTADLTGTTEAAPYVFTVYYEVREEAPEATPTPGPGAGPGTTVPSAPPQTGDEGPTLWMLCLILSGAGLMLLMTASRRNQRG